MIGFDGSTNIEVLALVQASLQMLPHVLGQLPKEKAEQTTKKWSSQVKSLLSKVISVVFLVKMDLCLMYHLKEVRLELSSQSTRLLPVHW